MSRRACKRVSFSPDPEANEEPIYPTHNGLSSSRHGRRRINLRIFSFGVRSSPAPKRLLRRIGASVTKTLRFMSLGRKTAKAKSTPFSSSRNVSSSSSLSCSSSSYSSSSIYLVKSKSVNESESHRAEAIEDCIEFLNSSSSLSRSNSISAWSC
ncbi:hypothetical protein EUTSA_v10014915mg [Eutrema salsugineum]|uniref:Josephin-like protein n=1 Tax=Eutrema salsugineum TaxID=72664 RepID=V4KQA7_EUTSA|nr:uncharacterized protein LOC18019465 [Eutrema salsugineum]ESQ40095.1 hypothetical protein EUTSA_v10014915mg [Eutrema salsugineum]